MVWVFKMTTTELDLCLWGGVVKQDSSGGYKGFCVKLGFVGEEGGE